VFWNRRWRRSRPGLGLALRSSRTLLPLLVLGLSILAVGGVIDLVAHTVPGSWPGLSPGVLAVLAETGHLASFVGMALTIAGLIVIGLIPERGRVWLRGRRG